MAKRICVLLGVLASVCVLNTNATSSMYKSAYCMKPSMVCRKGQSIGHTLLVPTINECRGRCNRHRSCVTFHMGENEEGVKTCTLRNQRCAESELQSGPGTDFYRLKKGESCPSSRPKFVRPPIKYSDDYCALPFKRCLGHNMYAKPQTINVFTSISEPYMACLKKCNGIRTCASVDFVSYKCIINDYHCPDGELYPAGAMDVNFMRLKPGENCPGNRHALGSEELDGIFPAGSETESAEPESAEPESAEPESAEPESAEPGSAEPESPQRPETQREYTTNTYLCPCNSIRNGVGECKCIDGFENVNNECILACPVGAARQNNGSCRCQPGTDSVGRECLPRCPHGTTRNGRGCE